MWQGGGGWYSRKTVAEANEPFLEITFQGGRFSSHSAPVGALAELATFQQIVQLVARQIFKQHHPERQRVPRGFPDAGQLHLIAVRGNCLTAVLARPDAGAWRPELFDRMVFEEARDVALRALAAAADGVGTLPAEFPASGWSLLGLVGRQLAEDEALLVRGNGQAARVNQRSRERIAAMVHEPVERSVVLDGEVEQVDDQGDRFWLRSDQGERIEVSFKPTQRKMVLEALSERPIARMRLRGQIILGPQRKLKTVDELDLVDHERAPDVQKLWARLDQLAAVPGGWFHGEGEAPSPDALVQAREILARLLVDHRNIERPKVYPTPDGGLQAEWILGDWAAEARFARTADVIVLEATHGITAEESSQTLLAGAVSADNATPIASWLKSLQAEATEHV